MDVGVVGGWSWNDDAGGGYDDGDGGYDKETVTIVDRRGVFPESAPTSRKAKAKAEDPKESVTTAVRRAIPRESAPKAKKEESQKEQETATREKAKDRGVGERGFGR